MPNIDLLVLDDKRSDQQQKDYTLLDPTVISPKHISIENTTWDDVCDRFPSLREITIRHEKPAFLSKTYRPGFLYHIHLDCSLYMLQNPATFVITQWHYAANLYRNSARARVHQGEEKLLSHELPTWRLYLPDMNSMMMDCMTRSLKIYLEKIAAILVTPKEDENTSGGQAVQEACRTFALHLKKEGTVILVEQSIAAASECMAVTRS